MTRPGQRRGALVAAALALTALVAACSPGAGASVVPIGSGTAPSTATAPTEGTAQTSAPQVTVPGEVDPIPSSAPSSSGSPRPSSSSSTPPPSSTPPAAPAAVITVAPADQAVDIDPVDPISVTVTEGTFDSVGLTNAETGVVVEGVLADDKKSWTVDAPILGYGKTYKIAATATDLDGRQTVSETTFTTVTPNNQTAVISSFPADGMTVGVGQPIAITFDEPIGDRDAAEAAITVTTDPVQTGAFHWISDKEVRWRPQNFWQKGTTVSVDVKIYGKDLGDGLYGQKDKQFGFAIGRRMHGIIDDNEKILRFYQDDVLVREIPVSMGSSKWPTMNGHYVIAEGYDKKIMDSSTWGLTGTGAYRTEVQYAVRMSSSGIFTHGAPWSEWAQGSENVSHGCLNMTIDHARWVYENTEFGDVISVQNTLGGEVPVWDGFGDWNLSWEEYSA